MTCLAVCMKLEFCLLVLEAISVHLARAGQTGDEEGEFIRQEKPAVFWRKMLVKWSWRTPNDPEMWFRHRLASRPNVNQNSRIIWAVCEREGHNVLGKECALVDSPRTEIPEGSMTRFFLIAVRVSRRHPRLESLVLGALHFFFFFHFEKLHLTALPLCDTKSR